MTSRTPECRLNCSHNQFAAMEAEWRRNKFAALKKGRVKRGL